MADEHTTGEQWYWDLDRQQVVHASERGAASNTMGPYRTRADAENWRSTVEQRNDAWDDADEEWEGTDDDDEE